MSIMDDKGKQFSFYFMLFLFAALPLFSRDSPITVSGPLMSPASRR